MLIKWTNNLSASANVNATENTQSLIQKLTDFRFKQNQYVSLKLADTLHFLRGGGSTWDESFSVRYEKYAIFEEKLLEQAYGRMNVQIGTSQCEKILEKIFRTTRKYDRKSIDDASVFLLCACMIQMLVHNFAWVIKYIIAPFLSDGRGTVGRMYIPLYVLNFLYLPQCKFSAHMSLCIDHLPINLPSAPQLSDVACHNLSYSTCGAKLKQIIKNSLDTSLIGLIYSSNGKNVQSNNNILYTCQYLLLSLLIVQHSTHIILHQVLLSIIVLVPMGTIQ